MPNKPDEAGFLQLLLSKIPPETARRVGAATPAPVTQGVAKVLTALGLANPLGAANLLPADEPYFRQYLDTTTDILPKQSLRPRAAKVLPGQVRRTPLPDSFEAYLTQRDTQQYPEASKSTPFPTDRLTAMKVGEILNNIEPTGIGANTAASLNGLGRFTSSLMRTPEGYEWSVYDLWDFASPSIPPAVQGFLEGAGTPYTVYDRFRLTPDERASGGYTLQRIYGQ
jgi:hypothetical protein